MAFAAPNSATRFLHGFASSANARYVERVVGLRFGLAFHLRASTLPWSTAFILFGGCRVITTACLFAVP